MRYFIRKAHKHRLLKPFVLVAVPQVAPKWRGEPLSTLLNRPAPGMRRRARAMAAAVGAGLPVNEPQANMIVDIGGCTCKWRSYPSKG
jgi:rod shape-determining protein MreB